MLWNILLSLSHNTSLILPILGLEKAQARKRGQKGGSAIKEVETKEYTTNTQQHIHEVE